MTRQSNQNGTFEDSRELRALLARWAEAVRGTDLPQPPSYDGPPVRITRLTEKSGDVTAGACFVARVRETSDGHPYIADAIANGAGMILAQRAVSDIDATIPSDVAYLQVPDTAQALAWLAAAWEGFPSRQLVMIGITGTDGKTSTANILLAMLRAAELHTGLLSTTRVVIGDEEEPLALHVTTPESPVVQHHLRRMVDAGMTHCILEATSHGLAQHRVGAIDFDLAVVTNITHEHLDYHGDFEGYLAAKSRLFAVLGDPGWQLETHNSAKRRQAKTAVLNQDDGSFERIAAVTTARQLTYALRSEADATGTDIKYSPESTRFVMKFRRKAFPDAPAELRVTSPLAGEFNVYNTLAASTAALAVGAGADAVARGLRSLEPISGRMERVERGQPYTVIVDFAHTPNALSEAIRAARDLTDGRVITVFGSAGKRDVVKRRRMAEISTQLADLTVLTAEDPRTESLDAILQAMADGCISEGGREGETFWRLPDRGKAIYFALSLAKTGDLVLVCGKGHEQSMCFGTTEYPWDDREATAVALQAILNDQPMPDLGLPTFDESE